MMRALLTRFEEQVEHDEMMAGIIAANVANHGFRQLSAPAEIADYMPSRYRKRQIEEGKQRDLSPEEWQGKLNRIFAT